MRPLAWLAALFLLPLGGCTLTFPLGAAALHQPAKTELIAEPDLYRGAFVVLTTTNGREHRGWLTAYPAPPDSTGPVRLLGRDNVTRAFERTRVREVSRTGRRPSKLGGAFLFGLATDALLLGLAYHAIRSSCIYDSCRDRYGE